LPPNGFAADSWPDFWSLETLVFPNYGLGIVVLYLVCAVLGDFSINSNGPHLRVSVLVNAFYAVV